MKVQAQADEPSAHHYVADVDTLRCLSKVQSVELETLPLQEGLRRLNVMRAHDAMTVHVALG
jgi:hypothetical protein